ncbi:uncharacterized protein [Physcomitrium patens]|uniref:cysteine--tRNA ligase n=1 Tax=Physcomitrium patens TaxID=3218 RepID=A0A2K1K2D9_PHYPA|nr:cysteine--tRNA ligase, cytoplasmic-like isoform X1 [Physcomitrium patens]PNR47944.1 hypothetical protein PHYPA_012417 [Physcomitrium patens]|eukprot:XP_024384144.1 cysteine--tRNA ligase, cytoplasmic-like isoform X1 [Physcomitrella patens]
MAPASDAPGDGEKRGLMVNNSLCKEKVPFFTKDGSRNVTWYICGPTVYDSSHVGHARNYVTFDIIRRILEDYFHYNVKYVMNVTDVDDKIINRARRNYLMDQYRSGAIDLNKVIEDLERAMEEELVKQQKKISDTEGGLEKATSSRQKDDLADRVKQEQLKVTKINEARDLLQGQKEEARKLGGKEGINMLLGGSAADSLASQLDARLGATVTDHAIYKSHTLKYENEFWDDMTALGCGYPDVLVRVTEYMDKIIEYVEVVLANKFAYVANGSVYFDTKAFREAGHQYGKLNPAAVGSSLLASESESNFETSEKRTSCDFALWKKSKPGEPAWESPWGLGRPGWHIECSAMASDILGDNMDIHSGGHDLQFPHHDNELAQSEAYFHCHEWVRYFFHSGHLSIDGLKMSKSLKNFITIKEALTKYTARQLRMLFVIQSWDKSINFSTTVVNEALQKEKQFKNFFANVESYLRQHPMAGIQRPGDDEKQLFSRVDQAQIMVRERLEDNFDTAGAVTELLTLVRDVHSYIDKCKSANGKPQPSLLKKAAIFVTKILVVFGLSDAKNDEIGFGSTTSQSGSTGNLTTVVAPYVDGWVSLRDSVRSAVKSNASQAKLMELTDKVRDEDMVDAGVCVVDEGNTSTWRLDDPQVLQRERDERRLKVKEEKLRVLRQKRLQKANLLEKHEASSTSPQEIFKTKDEYKDFAFDERGVPTHDKGGKELPKNAKKKFEAAYKKAVTDHEKFKDSLVKDPHFLQNLRAELQEIVSQILRLEQDR